MRMKRSMARKNELGANCKFGSGHNNYFKINKLIVLSRPNLRLEAPFWGQNHNFKDYYQPDMTLLRAFTT
jgi:hypothetical protein